MGLFEQPWPIRIDFKEPPHYSERAMDVAVIILAAGQGKRFQSATPKVLHPLAGRPLVAHAVQLAQALEPQRTVLVVGPGYRQHLAPALNGIGGQVAWAVQREPLGTAHAVQAASRALQGHRGLTVIIAGDVPLLRAVTIQQLVARVREQRPQTGGVLTVLQPDPTGYGRIVRGHHEVITRIVEERDASDDIKPIREVNTGIYCCDTQWLFRALRQIGRHNAQREFYLTDLAELAVREGEGLIAVTAADPEEFLGVNSRAELARVEGIFRRRLVSQWMQRGVSFIDPATTYLDVDIAIGADTVIGPSVTLAQHTRIGRRCRIEQGAVITACRIADDVVIKPYSVLDGAEIANGCQIGPFARLRPETRLAEGVRIGNFVETKKSWLKKGVKANHLTYLGDATIGAHTNIGCGTVTCNYDGKKKHPTIIGEHVFVGSDTQFVAPVRIGRGATTAAGSVITEDVPARALAIGRGRQINKRRK